MNEVRTSVLLLMLMGIIKCKGWSWVPWPQCWSHHWCWQWWISHGLQR